MENNRKLARWWMELQEFDYEVTYVTGKSNLVADCLSRMTTKVEHEQVILHTVDGSTCDNCKASSGGLVHCALCGNRVCDDC